MSLHEQGMIDATVYDTYLKDFGFNPPEQITEARSIVVASKPQPGLKVHFTLDGKDFPAIVPPTYANGLAVNNEAKAILERSLDPGEARFERAYLPLKTLAARTGLSKYGRNNITYIPEHGSFHRLVAFFTDMDLGTDDWQEREALPACKNCRKCIDACPASVISEDRFLIRVERCLTWFNEMPSDKPFPPGYQKEWHNAIVGCMRCQNACPYNQAVKGWMEESERFSEEETRYLLQGEFSDAMAKPMGEKLERCGLDLTTFPRNLKALLGL